jgi:hypothetical protein
MSSEAHQRSFCAERSGVAESTGAEQDVILNPETVVSKYRHAERPFDYAQGRLFDSAPARFVLQANVRCGRSAQDAVARSGVER